MSATHSSTPLPPFTHCSQLHEACAQWAQIALTDLKPRRKLDLSDKKADFQEALSALKRFAKSSGYKAPQKLKAHAALENAWLWQAAAQQACQLLIYGIDLGLTPAVLRPIFMETAALWRDTAQVFQHAQQAMSKESGEPYGVPAAIVTSSSEYKYAVQLLSLAVLLDAQEEISHLLEHVLAFDTDRLLDYLCAGVLELEEASETLYHRRPYGQLLPFFEQLGEAQPDLLRPYLQSEYEDFMLLSPKQQKKAGPWMGTGYWALEVAALSVLYDWDDTLLRESPNYPVDLVDCVRQ